MRAGFALCAINSHLSAGILTYETSITYINCFSQRQYGHLQNCYGIDFRSWRKELRTREKTKQTPCKLPDRVSRSLQGVLFKVYQISVLILLKKILFSFFSVCLPLFIRHIAAMLLRKTSSKTMQTVTKYLKELSGVRSDNSPNSYK